MIDRQSLLFGAGQDATALWLEDTVWPTELLQGDIENLRTSVLSPSEKFRAKMIFVWDLFEKAARWEFGVEKGWGRGGSLRGGMQMHLSGESLAGQWMGKLLFGPKGGLRGGAIWRGGSLKRGSVCKYKVSRERGLFYWPVGWESWYLPLPALPGQS